MDGDGIARQAGFGPGDHAVFTEQRVQQRGFAGIGPAHNGKAERAFFIFFLWLILGQRAKLGRDFIMQIAKAIAMFRTHRHRVAQAQFKGLHGRGGAGAAFGLIRNHQHRHAHPPEPSRESAIRGHDSGARIHHKQHEGGATQSGLRTRAHAAGHGIGWGFLKPGGIHQGHVASGDARGHFLPVTRDAGCIMHQRHAPLRQPVEQRGFAHIGPT